MSHVVKDVRLSITCGMWWMHIANVDADIEKEEKTIISVNAVCKVDGVVVGTGMLTPSTPSGTVQTYSGTFDIFVEPGDIVQAEAIADYQKQETGQSTAVAAPDCGSPFQNKKYERMFKQFYENREDGDQKNGGDDDQA